MILATTLACNKKNIEQTKSPSTEELEKYPKLVLAGGCFWCTQAAYQKTLGVKGTFVGYVYDDARLSPNYQNVASGETEAREAMLIYYDPNEIRLTTLLDIYWRHIDPTDAEGQFADRGSHYSTAIYFTTQEQEEVIIASQQQIASLPQFIGKENKIMTEILPLKNFAHGEEIHQNYKEKNPTQYERYFQGSGRAEFIKSFWDKIDSQKTIPQESSQGSSNKESGQVKEWQAEDMSSREKKQRVAKLDSLSEYVTQHDGTERPYENEFWNHKEDGIYVDIVSGEPLFLSTDKYDSKTGWPSFTKAINERFVYTKEDNQLGLSRTEIRSKNADSHLGHIFSDGPPEKGGQRYCINSAALRFIKKEEMAKQGYGKYIPLLE